MKKQISIAEMTDGQFEAYLRRNKITGMAAFAMSQIRKRMIAKKA